MDKKIENEIFIEADRMISWLLHRVREISGEFPVKVRITIFFGTGEARTIGHFMEHERLVPPEVLESYEKAFHEIEKRQLTEAASEILKGKNDTTLSE
jgi:hypothetical protein